MLPPGCNRLLTLEELHADLFPPSSASWGVMLGELVLVCHSPFLIVIFS